MSTMRHREGNRFSIDQPRVLLLCLSFMLLVSAAKAAVREVVRLAADLNTTPKSANISGLTIINDELYFAANDGTHGLEMWKSDGTNVTRLTDISYGSSSSFVGPPALYNGDIYFRAGSTTNGLTDIEL